MAFYQSASQPNFTVKDPILRLAGEVEQLKLQLNGESVAIGLHAGQNDQGTYSIAIGNNAGVNSQPSNSIILNADSATLDAANSGLFINPIRQDITPSNLLAYDTTSKEVVYQPGVWYDFVPSITGPNENITLGQAYGRYTVIGKTCMGNAFINVSSIIQSSGKDALEFILPVIPHSSYANEATGTASIGAGSLTIK